MKATLLKRGATPDHSFSVANHDFSYFLKVWHYHEELELVYMIKSQGTRFIGDSIERFQEGELLLIGSNLAHMFQNDDSYFEEDSERRAEACVIHFNSQFLNTNLAGIPEFREISQLIERAKLGLKFSESIGKEVGQLMLAMNTLNELDRMLSFLKVLGILSKQTQVETIASPGFVNHFAEAGDSKLDKVYDYVMNNFQEEIKVDDIADLVSMNKSSFCRYFKKTTQKTFTEFLNDVRVGFACKMLLENEMSILEVSYYCGYNNISHFNRQFRTKMDMSPTDYLKYRGALNSIK